MATLVVHDQEYHTSFWGHSGLLGLRRNVILPGYAGYANTAAASLDPINAAVFDQAHAQDGLTGYVHPFDSYPDPRDTTRPLTHELPVDVALGKVDYYEAIGFVDDYEATANFASLRGPVGMNRVFAKIAGPLSHRPWLAALKAGRTFATNGPLLGFTLDGKELGSELAIGARRRELLARVTLNSIVSVDHLEIVRNGEVLMQIPLPGDRTKVSTSVRVPVRGSGWYLLRARGNGPAYPILDLYPYATTSPIYVTVAGQPIRSPRDAEYFLAWIARLEAATLASKDWNTEGEKASALASIRQARTEFERRGGAR